MNRATQMRRAERGEIRVNLSLPVTRVGFGMFSFDPLEQMIGAPLSEILASLMTGPCYQRASASGAAVDVYPLALPEGEGASVPLGQFGELGFRNERGTLVLTVPASAARWVEQRLGNSVIGGPDVGVSTNGTARVASYWLRLPAGKKASFPLGALGEVGVEAA
jgi:hypothetical protein